MFMLTLMPHIDVKVDIEFYLDVDIDSHIDVDVYIDVHIYVEANKCTPLVKSLFYVLRIGIWST